MDYNIIQLKAEVEQELTQNILPFWIKEMPDTENGGFFGQIDANNRLIQNAPKGGILNSRILWTFSAAYRITGNTKYLEMAIRAKDFLLKKFIDPVFGGVYWELDALGNPTDTKKQIYNLGFAIYGLSEFHRATNDTQSLEESIILFNMIEKYSFDPVNNGYFEAFTREWAEIADMRLSEKDANEKKTMNTHLHILEPYTNLYRVWKSPDLKLKIQNLIRIFLDRILKKENQHLGLFFDEEWNSKSDSFSYGHDIEAAWLIHEAAIEINDCQLLSEVRKHVLPIVDAALEGYQPDGSLAYEYDAEKLHTDTERHWWVQAETMVGAYDAFELSEDEKYLDVVFHTWEYIKANIIDNNHGEWIWSRMPDGSIHSTQDKAGFWKCPYHNGRMCMELIVRLSSYLNCT
jgi:mannobiose 2-epimerase